MPLDNTGVEIWHHINENSSTTGKGGLVILLHIAFPLTEMMQVERKALDLVSSFRTGGEELNCLGEVSDKESVLAWMLGCFLPDSRWVRRV